MTRMNLLWSFLTGETERANRLESARQAAMEAYDAAKRRGDTRGQHVTLEALKKATNEALKRR